MKPILLQATASLHAKQYDWISHRSKLTGKGLAFFCAPMELISPTLRVLMGIVESAALIALNFLGAIVGAKRCNLKDAIGAIGFCFVYTTLLPFAVLLGVAESIRTLFAMLQDSQKLATETARNYRMQHYQISRLLK